MAKYEGIAVMYMTMPMSAQTLPIQGRCQVNDKKISLQFPLSGVSFDLPESPKEGAKMEFKMAGGTGEMTLTIQYKHEMNAFIGHGRSGAQNLMSFCFYKPESPLKALKEL